MSMSRPWPKSQLAHAELRLIEGDGEAEAVVDGEERHEPP